MTIIVVVNQKNETAIASDALCGIGEERRLPGRLQAFRRFQKLHAVLKDKYFLNSKNDEADPDQSSQITAVIAKPTVSYGVYSCRQGLSFDKLRGVGSGRGFALGAMFTSDERLRGARRVAEIGVRVGREFDKSSALPRRIFSFPMVIATENQEADA